MHGVDRFRQPGIAQDLYPAGGVAAPARYPAADNQRGHHVRQPGEDPGIACLAGEDSRSIAASSGWISGQVLSRLLTRITSGMAFTSGCMPPSSKSIQPLKMTARSGQSGWSPALIQLTVLHTVSLGSCATLTTVACGSESRACPSPLGINSASPLSR